MSVLCSVIIFLDVTYSAAISDSAADAITVLMFFLIFNTGPLSLVWDHFLRERYVLLLGYGILIR